MAKVDQGGPLVVPVESQPESALRVIKTGMDRVQEISAYVPAAFINQLAPIVVNIWEIAETAKSNRSKCEDLKQRVEYSLGKLDEYLKMTGYQIGEKNLAYYVETLKNIEKYLEKLANPKLLEVFLRYLNPNQFANEIEDIYKNFDRATMQMMFSTVMKLTYQYNPPPIPKKEDTKLLALLNGSVPNTEFIKDFRKSSNFVEFDRVKPVTRQGNQCIIVKKVTKMGGQPVAERELKIPFNSLNVKMQCNFWSQIAICDQLSRNCDFILKTLGFYDLSGKRYLITEWAKHGDLQRFLKNHPNLSWNLKVKIAYQVSVALAHCHQREILHHDVRSHNVFLGDGKKVKLTNFWTSRPFEGDISWPIKDRTEKLRWTAPEKMNENSEGRYTPSCDVYSFGMLLYEIAAQEIPFGHLQAIEASDEVEAGHRPSSEIPGIPPEYRDLMVECWDQHHYNRPQMEDVCQRLTKLYKSFEKNRVSPQHNGHLSVTPTFYELENSSSSSMGESEDIDPDVMPQGNGKEDQNTVKAPDDTLETAQKYHKEKRYAEAFPIFENLANQDVTEAEFRVGLYLLNGPPYVPQKDPKRAKFMLYTAADKGHSDAQYWYGVMLLATCRDKDYFEKHVKVWLLDAANQDHADALYEYGKLCFSGKWMAINRKEGKKYLMAAHYQGNAKALEKLKNIEAEFEKRQKMKSGGGDS